MTTYQASFRAGDYVRIRVATDGLPAGSLGVVREVIAHTDLCIVVFNVHDMVIVSRRQLESTEQRDQQRSAA